MSLCICTNLSKVKIPLRRLDKEYDQYLRISRISAKTEEKNYQIWMPK